MSEKIKEPRNIVKTTAKMIAKLKQEFERYHDKRYHLARGKKNGVYMWKWKMWKRARQIEYFKRRRWMQKYGK